MQDNGFEKSEQWATEIVAQRNELIDSVAGLPYVEKVWPSDANFFLCQMESAHKVLDFCASRGVLLRSFDKDLASCIRITVGSAEENRRLLQVLQEFEA